MGYAVPAIFMAAGSLLKVPINDAGANKTVRINGAGTSWEAVTVYSRTEADAAFAGTSHTHDAAAITSGTLDPARIPVLFSGVQVISSSATIAGLSAGEQAQIVQGAIVTLTDGTRWTYDGSGSKTDQSNYIQLADITPDWSVITNKPSLAILDSANTFTAQNLFARGELTASAPFTVSETWNNAAVTFAGVKLNFTDTASNGNSTGFDVQRSGTSVFNVICGSNAAIVCRQNLSVTSVSNENNTFQLQSSQGLNMANTWPLRFSSTNAYFGTVDTYIQWHANETIRWRADRTTSIGPTLRFEGKSDTTSGRLMASFVNSWAQATEASVIKSRLTINVSDRTGSTENTREAFRIISDGTNAYTVWGGNDNASGATQQIQIRADALTGILSQTAAASAATAAQFLFRRSQGTVASPSNINNADTLFNIIGQGYHTSFSAAATIRAKIDGTPGSGDMPGRIELLTSADGSGTPTLRAIFNAAGQCFFAAPTTAPSASLITATGSICITLDEGTDLLTITAFYSDLSTVKTATVALI